MFPAQEHRVLFLKGLYADADFCYAGMFGFLQKWDCYILRVQLDSDSLCYCEILSERFDDFRQAFCCEGRCSAAAEEQNTHAHFVQEMYFSFDLPVGMNYGGYVVYRTVLAFQKHLQVCGEWKKGIA